MNEYTDQSEPKRGNAKNIVIGFLIAALIITGGLFIFDHNKSGNAIETQQVEIAKVTSEKSNLQTSFDASLARLDSLQTENTAMNSKLTESKDEIAKMKTEIRSILNKRNATTAELTRARSLIAELNGKISDMEGQIAALTQENEGLKQNVSTLTSEKEVLSHNLDSTNTVKEQLAQKVDVASTLNASNISITPVKVRNNGKEKVSSVAKRVDKLVVTFDVSNRIIQPGVTDVYVVVTGPDGKAIAQTAEDTSEATFTTREAGVQTFTAKLPVDLQTSVTKNVEFSFAPQQHFKEGNYKIEIYQNGFLIGQQTRELRKGGLFS